jgi:predicted double-glycine peptidase
MQSSGAARWATHKLHVPLILLAATGLLGGGAAFTHTLSTNHATLSSAAKPAVTIAPSGTSGYLGPLTNIPQTWNNCGPSAVAEVLAYWGITHSQAQVQAVLRADGDPLGMDSYGVPAYMRSLGLRALVGVAGSERLLKALISNGFPVIVDQYISMSNQAGHYRPIQAYDDKRGVYVSSDPYLGQGHEIRYADFTVMWQSTNRQFLVLYPPGREAVLQAVLAAAGWNRTCAYRQDLAYQQGLLKGAIPDPSLEGNPKSYYLAVAWDQVELGQATAMRQAIQQALRLGASPIATSWISAELAARS